MLFDNQLERHESSNLSTDLGDTGGVCEDEILGNPITPKEIHEQISKLRTTKASGMDSILNENNQTQKTSFTSFLRKIFNNVLDQGHFPSDWNIGVIKLIYKKKGDKRFRASYKGITLTSCLGKLFTSI